MACAQAIELCPHWESAFDSTDSKGIMAGRSGRELGREGLRFLKSLQFPVSQMLPERYGTRSKESGVNQVRLFGTRQCQSAPEACQDLLRLGRQHISSLKKEVTMKKNKAYRWAIAAMEGAIVGASAASAVVAVVFERKKEMRKKELEEKLFWWCQNGVAPKWQGPSGLRTGQPTSGNLNSSTAPARSAQRLRRLYERRRLAHHPPPTTGGSSLVHHTTHITTPSLSPSTRKHLASLNSVLVLYTIYCVHGLYQCIYPCRSLRHKATTFWSTVNKHHRAPEEHLHSTCRTTSLGVSES